MTTIRRKPRNRARTRASYEGIRGLFWSDALVPPRHRLVQGVVLLRDDRDEQSDRAERARRVEEYARRYAATGRVFRG